MYALRYDESVRLTITRLRQDLFKLVDRTLEGETLEFTYKGVVFRVTPETKQSKLAKLSSQKVVASDADLAAVSLLPSMESEWERDWAEL